MAGPRPVRAVLRPLQPHPVRPALPFRLRPRTRRPQGAAHVGVQDARSPRGAPHRVSRSPPARSARASPRPWAWRWPSAVSAGSSTPMRQGRRERLRPPHLGPRLRRRRHGGGLPRGLLARRPPATGQPHRHLRPEPDLHRGRHRHLVQRGRRRALPAYGWDVRRRLARRPRRPGGHGLCRGRRRAAGRDSRAGRRHHRPPSSCCAPSSPGPRPPSRTPASRTARPSASPRSRLSRSVLGFDPRSSFEVDPEVLAHARKVKEARQGQAHSAWDKRYAGWRKAHPERRRPAGPARRRRAARGARQGPADLGRRPQGASPPAPRPARSSPPWPESCPSCGAARPTSPSPTTRRWRASRPSSPDKQTRAWKGGPYGRTLHFGIREFGMG
jgi:hypothetical protein